MEFKELFSRTESHSQSDVCIVSPGAAVLNVGETDEIIPGSPTAQDDNPNMNHLNVSAATVESLMDDHSDLEHNLNYEFTTIQL